MRIPLILMAAAVGCCGNAEALQPSTHVASAAERAAAGIEGMDAVMRVRDPAPASSLRAPHAPVGVTPNYATRIGSAFSGRTSDFDYFTLTPSLACQSGSSEKFADATLNLPYGVRVQYLDVFAFDISSTADMQVYLFSACQATASTSDPVLTQLGSVSTSGAAGNAFITIDFSSAPIVVDSYSCRYFARARMTDVSESCVDSQIYLDKVRAQYLPAITP